MIFQGDFFRICEQCVGASADETGGNVFRFFRPLLKCTYSIF